MDEVLDRLAVQARRDGKPQDVQITVEDAGRASRGTGISSPPGSYRQT